MTESSNTTDDQQETSSPCSAADTASTIDDATVAEQDNTIQLYCRCKRPSDCSKCGVPLKDREETRDVVHALERHPRHSDFAVFGNGPLLVSNIPESCQTTTADKKPQVHVGIDEAGRGSVLGPMVYGAAYWNADVVAKIPKGFQDSKALTEDTRSHLFDKLLHCDDIGFVARSLLPAEISRNMLRTMPYNLNQMSHDAAMLMIHKIVAAGINVTKCFVDTVGNPHYYKTKLEKEFPSIDFVVESKADAKYATCSAASVVAKVLRDRMLSNWVSNVPEVSPDIGSGYPSDPKCKAWMDDLQHPLFGYCDLVRFSWAPTKQRLEEKGHQVVFQADIDDDDALLAQEQKGMNAFLNHNNTKKRKRLGYFERNKLQVVHKIVV